MFSLGFFVFSYFSLDKKSLSPSSGIPCLRARGSRYKTSLFEFTYKCFVMFVSKTVLLFDCVAEYTSSLSFHKTV